VIEAPEGVEFNIVIYLTSDLTGIDITVSLQGLCEMASLKEVDVVGLCGALPPLASDWRIMTREEIKEFKDDESR
jgi:hypothetical protein